jgi:hypothetical protein
MLKPGLLAVLALGLVAGCVTVADVDKAKASWNGATYDEVVMAWGQPASQMPPKDGLQPYTWISQSAGYGTEVGAYGGSGGSGVGISMPLPGMGGMVSGYCQRTLSFKGGRVVDQLWQGTTRYCSIFSRY